ncbi:MAG: hypothetical protein ACK5H4_05065 [Lacrimispora sphenoides]
MIKEINNSLQEFNQRLGITVKLPEPKKKQLKNASLLNFVVGTGLITSSMIFAPKWCAALGSIAIISGITMRYEAKKQ